MTREEFIERLSSQSEDIANVLREFAYTGDKEDIARVLIEYDWTLYRADNKCDEYLEYLLDSLRDWWDLNEDNPRL